MLALMDFENADYNLDFYFCEFKNDPFCLKGYIEIDDKESSIVLYYDSQHFLINELYFDKKNHMYCKNTYDDFEIIDNISLDETILTGYYSNLRVVKIKNEALKSKLEKLNLNRHVLDAMKSNMRNSISFIYNFFSNYEKAEEFLKESLNELTLEKVL